MHHRTYRWPYRNLLQHQKHQRAQRTSLYGQSECNGLGGNCSFYGAVVCFTIFLLVSSVDSVFSFVAAGDYIWKQETAENTARRVR